MCAIYTDVNLCFDIKEFEECQHGNWRNNCLESFLKKQLRGVNFLQTVADSIKKEVQRDRKQVPWIQMREKEKEIPRFKKNSQPCFKFSTGTEKKLHRNFASNIQKYIISALLSPVFQWAAFSL